MERRRLRLLEQRLELLHRRQNKGTAPVLIQTLGEQKPLLPQKCSQKYAEGQRMSAKLRQSLQREEAMHDFPVKRSQSAS